MLSMKDLLFKDRLAKKLMKKYIDLYIIEEVIFANAIKIRLPTSMRIHPVVKISVTYH